MNLVLECRHYGVEFDIEHRRRNRTPHHPEAIALMQVLPAIDCELAQNYLRLGTGTDGGNGELLLYELDVYFELQEAKARANRPQRGTFSGMF
jgi:hypothetical protein